MPSSRASILTTLRRSLASAKHLPAAPPVETRWPTDLLNTDHSSLATQFASELQTVSGKFIHTTLTEAPALVAQLLHERQATAALTWAQPHLPVPGLHDLLRGQGVALDEGAVPSAEPARSARLAEIEKLKMGITGIDAALADTGTLALRSGPGRPRLASLSVRTHIALFTPPQLHASWAQWWAALPDKAEWARTASNLVFITGPSRTADIEMTLTVGVHGPAEVIAILCAP